MLIALLYMPIVSFGPNNFDGAKHLLGINTYFTIANKT